MLHAHIETYATDCDGLISRTYVMQMNDEELAGQDKPNWFGDIHFIDRVVIHIGNFYALWHRGTLTVECEDEGSTEKTFVWQEETEEGHRTNEARICTDESCDLEEPSTYRDHRAEQYGY